MTTAQPPAWGSPTTYTWTVWALAWDAPVYRSASGMCMGPGMGPSTLVLVH